jgi:hypothetical protein
MLRIQDVVDATSKGRERDVCRVEREQIRIDDNDAITTLDEQCGESPKSRDAPDHPAHEHIGLGAVATDDDCRNRYCRLRGKR